MEFGERERALLARMLRNMGEQTVPLSPNKLTSFASMKGERFAGELIVVGRAVNRWGPGFTAIELMEEAALNRVIEKTVRWSRGRGDKNGCPMLWVSDLWGNRGNREDGEKYNTKKSAFWRVIRSVAGKLGVDIDKPARPTCLAWSNFYRVAPFLGGKSFCSPPQGARGRVRGSPGSGVCRMEAKACADANGPRLGSTVLEGGLLVSALSGTCQIRPRCVRPGSRRL